MPSKQEKKLKEIRNKFLGIEEKFSVKSYYPQLKEKIIELEENETFLKEKSLALLNMLDDLESERKKVIQSEEKFRFLAENSRDMIYRMSIPDGAYEYVSPSSLEMIGYLPEEIYLSPMLIREIIHPDWQNYLNEQLEAILNDKTPSSFEYKIIDRNGNEKWLNQRNSYIYDKSGKLIAIQGIVSDITDGKRVELELKESEEKYKALFNASDDAIFIVKGNKFIDCNAKTLEMFGCRREDILNHFPYEFSPKVQTDGRNSKLKVLEKLKLATNGQPQHFEWLCSRLDGSIFFAEVILNTIYLKGELHIQAIIRDISKRKKAEESKLLLAQTLESFTEIATITDLEDNLIYVNEAFLRTYGYKHSEILGKNISIIWSPNNPEGLLDEILKGSHNGTWQGEALNLTKCGKEFPVSLHTSQVKDEDGKIVALVGVSADISEQRRMNSMLKEKNYLLTKSQEVGNLGSYYMDVTTGNWISSAKLDDIFGINDTFQKNVKGWLAIIYPEDIEELKNHFNYVIGSRNKFDKEYRIVRYNDKQERIVHGLGELEFSDDGKPLKIIGTIQDITERKEAEETLRQREEQLKLAIEGSGAGLWDWKVQTGELRINDSWAQICGYTLQELEPISIKTWDNLVHSDDLNKSYKLLQNHFSGKAPAYECEIRMKHRDGRWIWILDRGKVTEWDTEGKPVRMAGTHVDITGRKQMEEALEKRIVALTQPLDIAASISFEELFNVKEIQKIQDLFAQATGVASIVTRTDGTPITEPSNFCYLCNNIIRKTDEGRKNCYYSDAVIGRYNPDGPIVQPCLSGGLWDAGASITVGGKHIANWLIGQVRDETQNEKKMIEYARKIGADEKEFLEAFYKVPTMSRVQFEQISNALYSIADQLSTSAYQNIQQARFITERKAAEEALKKSEEQLRGIAQNIPGMVYQFYASKDGKVGFHYVSDSSMKYIGLDNKHLEDMFDRFLSGIAEEDREQFISSVQSAISNVSQWDFVGRYMKPDGGKIWFRGISQPRMMENELVFDGILLDITEQKYTDEKIKQLANLNQTILDTMTAGLTFVKNRRQVWFNTSFCKIFGYEFSEIFDTETSMFYANTEDFNKIGVEGYGQLAKGEVYSAEMQMKRKDGTLIWCNLVGKALNPNNLSDGSIWMLQDITKRKKAEEALRNSEEKFVKTFKSTPAAMVISEIESGLFLDVNDNWCSMLGYYNRAPR